MTDEAAKAGEFPRPVRLDTLGAGERAITIAAEAGERAALARRFGLVSLDRLEASIRLKRAGPAVHAEGSLHAELVQSCVATGDPLPLALDETFVLRFLPEEMVDAATEELELSEEDCDTVPYTGGAIDIGEAVAETLALALPPFPRGPHADAALRAAGVLSEGEVEGGPFAALKGLRDRLKG